MSSRPRKFAAEYVRNGFNGVQAAISAGYTSNYNAACVQASVLLRNPKVAKSVEDHIKSAGMSAVEVLQRLTDIARTDTDFKGSDVVKAVELLGKGHKLFTDRVESTNETTIHSDPETLQTFYRAVSKIKPGITLEECAAIYNDSMSRIEGDEERVIG